MKKSLITWVMLALLALLVAFLGYKTADRPKFQPGEAISPNLNLGVNSSSSVVAVAGTVITQRIQNQFQWCYNGAAGIWIGVTTTNLVAGANGAGVYIPTSTVINSVIPNFSEYTGNIYGVTLTGTTSTVVCTRF